MQLAARPESESLASKPLSTLWLYQPAPFGSVVGPESLITGAVVSTLTVSEAVSLLVVLSETEQLPACVVSAKTLVVQVPETPATSVSEVVVLSVQLGAPARPEPASLAVTVSVTEAVLFQPAVFELWETERLGLIESCSVSVVVVSPLLLGGDSSTLSATSVEIV